MKTIYTLLILLLFAIVAQAQTDRSINYIGYRSDQLTDTLTRRGFVKVDSLSSPNQLVFKHDSILLRFKMQKNVCKQYNLSFPVSYVPSLIKKFNAKEYKLQSNMSFTRDSFAYIFYYDKKNDNYNLRITKRK